MRRTQRKIKTVDQSNEGQEIEASKDAIIITRAIYDLAEAIREHGRAMMGDELEDVLQYDLSGNPI